MTRTFHRQLQWLDGWRGYWRAVYMSRKKKHGAGARYLIYGQHYPDSWSFRRMERRFKCFTDRFQP